MITIAICTVDRHEFLNDLLNHLQPQINSHDDYKLLVIDSAADISIGENIVSRLFPPNRFTYLRGSKHGLSAAKNIAVEACTTRFLAFIDDDAIPAANWISKIVSTFMDVGDNCASIGGRIEPIWLAPRPIWLADELLPYLSILDLGNEQRELAQDENLYGTNIAYRHSSLLISGGFRTELGRTRMTLLSNEETDLQSRLAAHGMKIVYVPEIMVKHKIPAERLDRQWFCDRIYWQAISDRIALCTDNDKCNTLIAKLKDTPACPDKLINSDYCNSNNPELFLKNCSSIYKNTSEMVNHFMNETENYSN